MLEERGENGVAGLTWLKMGFCGVLLWTQQLCDYQLCKKQMPLDSLKC
jgi:hypothetical protein